MSQATAPPDSGDLLRELQENSAKPAAVIAVLWTWLEWRLVELAARREKPPAIYKAAIKTPYEGMTDEVLTWVLDDPLRNAAELLARIAHKFGDPKAPLIQMTRGIQGEEVLVAWRHSELVRRMGGDEFPPSAAEHPSLTTLAPCFVVCRRFAGEVEIDRNFPRGRGWLAARQFLDDALSGDQPNFAVHLDTLATHGMSGWHGSDVYPDGFFDSERIKEQDEKKCIEAVEAAVEEASGRTSILILPELAATPKVVDALCLALRDHPKAPALTVVGLYHLSADTDEETYELVADEDLANHLNEAVVFGPDGSELWRHRKLSCAEGEIAEDEPKMCEDIRPGRKMEFVATSIGNLAVMICLDCFALQGRERLAKSPANVLLIPSLSPTVRRHKDSLRHLVEVIWGAAFVCNRSPEPDAGADAWNAEETRSFWASQRVAIHLPPARQATEHPSFVFRLDGGSSDEGEDVEDAAA